MSEEVVNRFLNMIATEYDGNLARQFQNQYILRYKEIEQLQQRIDKAIEYLKAMQNSDLIFTEICEKELLEILGDKE